LWSGVFRPGLARQDASNCLRRDAVLGRKPAGGAHRLGPPHSEDGNGLLRGQPDSASNCLWLRVHYAVGTAPSGCLGRGKLGACMQSRSWIKVSDEPRRDCFRRDAVLGRKPAGGAHRLGPPHSEDGDGLLCGQPDSASN